MQPPVLIVTRLNKTNTPKNKQPHYQLGDLEVPKVYTIGTMSTEHPPQHVPVLLQTVLQLLDPQPGESYLDLTAGYGGHAGAVLERTGNYKGSVLVDRDDYAISHLASFENRGARLLHTDFVTAARQLSEEGARFSTILVDLGVSSPQLDQGERGFSFTNSGPLDMRMDRRQEQTANDLINNATVRHSKQSFTSMGRVDRRLPTYH